MTSVDLTIFLFDFFYNIIVYKLIHNIKFNNDIVDRRLKSIENSMNNLVLKFYNLIFQNIINVLSSVFIKKFTIFVIDFRKLFIVNSISTFKNENIFREN